MGGNQTATGASRPQTGFEDRPGHQAHTFQRSFAAPILIHRLTVAAGEDAGVAYTAGDAYLVGVLEPDLGILAARSEAIAETAKGYLTLFPARGLYLLQDRLCRPCGREEPGVEPHDPATLEEQAGGRGHLHRGRLRPGLLQILQQLSGFLLYLRRHFVGIRQAYAGLNDPNLRLFPFGQRREQGVREARVEPRCGPGLGHGELRALGPLL